MVARASGNGGDGLAASLRRARRRALLGFALVSAFVWFLPIAYAVYAMLLLDVGMPGRSGPTILGLLALSAALIAIHIVLLALRHDIARRYAAVFESHAHAAGFGVTRTPPPQASRDRTAPLRAVEAGDLDLARGWLAGGAATALVDLAGVPLYLVTLVLLGWPLALLLAVAVAVAVVMLALARRRLPELRDAARDALAERDTQSTADSRNVQLLQLLGLGDRARDIEILGDRAAAEAHAALDRARAATVRNVSVLLALTLAAMAALAVWQVAGDAARVGTVGAALLLTVFALLPARAAAERLDLLLAARAAHRRVAAAIRDHQPPAPTVLLPPPAREIEIDRLGIMLAGSRRPLLQGVTATAQAGDMIAVIGPSGIGRSILLKVLAGVLPPASGEIRLDGSTLDQWDPAVRTRHIGYLPQQPSLLPGTVAENIARFDPDLPGDAVIDAARAAGAHDLIVRLPQGYDTPVDDDRAPLPVSVQHRIALARALLGDPFLLLLDSPDTFQDREGMDALARALRAARDRGAIVIAAGHGAAVVEQANLIMLLRKGAMVDFGPKDVVRDRMMQQRRDVEVRLKDPQRDSAQAAPAVVLAGDSGE